MAKMTVARKIIPRRFFDAIPRKSMQANTAPISPIESGLGPGL
jgi:hypothetical protein